MPGSPTPPVIVEAFGASAGSSYITNPIPVPSQIGIKAGAASFTDGFPPLSMTAEGSGGVAMYGQDMNGILYMLSAYCAAMTGGQFWQYNSTYESSAGGYALGAILAMAAGNGFWLNTSSGNTHNPDTTSPPGNSLWVPLLAYGVSTITGLTGGTLTLSAAQAATPTIVLEGTLTSNLQIQFPYWAYNWRIFNATTGNYTVTVAGIQIPQLNQYNGGFTELCCDGTNIYLRGHYCSGLFTATLNGVSGTVTGTINFEMSGRLCTLYAPSAITGTSVDTPIYLSGLPYALQPNTGALTTWAYQACPVHNNNSDGPGSAYYAKSGATIQLAFSQVLSPGGAGAVIGYQGGGATAGNTVGVSDGWQFIYPMQ
jgi:hypothetical protein